MQSPRTPVITVDLVGKASFLYSCMQGRLIGQYNGNDPLASFMSQNH